MLQPWPSATTLRYAAVQVDKHRLVQDLCVRYRDLLTLDPSVPIPYPASLLIRCVTLACIALRQGVQHGFGIASHVWSAA